jgi:hypothetical protein
VGNNDDSRSQEIRLQSWLLFRSVAIDKLHRGFLSDLLRLPIARRQAAFACLSRIPDYTDIEGQIATSLAFGSAAELARHLLTAKAPEIVETAFGCVPEQFVGGLIRCGPMCLADRAHYARLFQCFGEPGFERHRRAVIDLGRISSHTIRVIDELDPLLLDHRIVVQFTDVEDARKVSEAFHLIRAFSSTTDEEWGRMIEQVAADGGKITCSIRRWLARADRLPAAPFDGGKTLKPLATASTLVDAAKRFQNCLRGKIHLVLSGRVAYYEHTGEVPAIVEIAPLSSGQWGVIGIYGIGNADISPKMVLHQIMPTAPEGYGALIEVIRAWDDPFFGEFAA